MVAADAVLIPVQAEFLALEGISQLTETIERVRDALNPGLHVCGVLMTMFDERTNLARQVVDEVRGAFGERVYRTIVPRNVRLSEAPSHGKPIFLYDIRSRGAEAYLRLAEEFIEHEEKSARERVEEPDTGVQVEEAGPRAGPTASAGAGDPAHRPRPDPPQSEPAP
jgi:chromosome partitioning protein